MVYELVNSLKSLPDNEYIPLDSVYVSQTLSDEFGAKHGHVKALSTLNQLHNKGLIKKKTFTHVKRGNVAIFSLARGMPTPFQISQRKSGSFIKCN